MFDRSNQLIDKLSIDADRRAAEADRRATEADRRAAEAAARSAELDRKFEEMHHGFKETKQLFNKLGIKADKINTKVEGISKSNGLFAEEYFFNSLGKKMEFAGIHFNDISTGGDIFERKVKMPDGSIINDQFDIVMRNGSSVAIIEIKYKAESSYVKTLATNKVTNFRILFPEYENFDIYLGLGSLSFSKSVINKAREYGVVLLKQVGNTIEYKTDWAAKAY
jgi:hypothetical protein